LWSKFKLSKWPFVELKARELPLTVAFCHVTVTKHLGFKCGIKML